MEQKHILIIDDEVEIRRSIKFSMELEGYKVSIAGNGLEAINIMEDCLKNKELIDLLITDIQMPEMTGLEMIDEMEKRQICFPILVMTGFGSKDMVVELLRRGVKDYLDKPFVPEKLKSRVERFFDKSKDVSFKVSLAQVKQEVGFVVEVVDGWAQLNIECEYSDKLQENFRAALLDVLDDENPLVRIDMKKVHEVDITFLNALVSFSGMHRKNFPEGDREIVNVHSDIMTLFKAVDLSECFNFSLTKELINE